MAGFQKIDKKQLPQVLGLGAASFSLFGYFAYKMITPSAAAAPQTGTAKPATAAGTGTTATAKPGPAPAAAALPVTDAPPPTPLMRNPFLVAIDTTPAGSVPVPQAGKGTQVANAAGIRGEDITVPSAPTLPRPGGLSPLPSAGGPSAAGTLPMPVAPGAQSVTGTSSASAWTVTGVLQSGGENVAILRNGEIRQFARRGDVVGGEFRVVDVTRQLVVLRHGDSRFTLPLGGPKVEAPVKKPAPSPILPPMAVPTPQAESTPQTAVADAAVPTAPVVPTDATAVAVANQAVPDSQPRQDAVQTPVEQPKTTADKSTDNAQALSSAAPTTETH